MGSGQCVHWAPGVFSQDDEGISVVVDPSGEPEAKIVTAVTCCPVEAISLRIDGIRIEAAHLRDWHRGSLADHPLVDLLEAVSSDHDELRCSLDALRHGHGEAADAVAAVEDPGGKVEDAVIHLVTRLSSHQSLEEDIVYPLIAGLVGDPLVDAFSRHHARIKEVLEEWQHPSVSADRPPDRDEEFVRVLDNLIRLEEAILFPVALGMLGGDTPPPAPAAEARRSRE